MTARTSERVPAAHDLRTVTAPSSITAGLARSLPETLPGLENKLSCYINCGLTQTHALGYGTHFYSALTFYIVKCEIKSLSFQFAC